MKSIFPISRRNEICKLLGALVYKTTNPNLVQLFLPDYFSLPIDHAAAQYFFNIYSNGTWDAKAGPFADKKRIPEMERLMEKTLAALT